MKNFAAWLAHANFKGQEKVASYHQKKIFEILKIRCKLAKKTLLDHLIRLRDNNVRWFSLPQNNGDFVRTRLHWGTQKNSRFLKILETFAAYISTLLSAEFVIDLRTEPRGIIGALRSIKFSAGYLISRTNMSWQKEERIAATSRKLVRENSLFRVLRFSAHVVEESHA